MKHVRWLFAITCLIASSLFLSYGQPASAQDSTASSSSANLPDALGPDAMRSLVSKLNPDQTQALVGLVELLNTSINNDGDIQQVASESAADLIRSWGVGFVDAVVHHVIALPATIVSVGGSLVAIFADRTLGESILFLIFLGVAIAIGMVAEKIFNGITSSRREKIRGDSPESLLGILKALSYRAILDVGGVIIFAIAVLVASRFIFSDAVDRLIASAFVINAVLIVRIVSALLRFILAPQRADLRLVSTDDWTARYIYRGLAGLAGFIGVGLFFIPLFNHFGNDHLETFRFWASLITHGAIIYVTWKTREGMTSIIKGADEYLTPGLAKMAAWWPPICIVLIAFNWFLVQFIVSTGNQSLTPVRGAMALVLIIILPFLDTIVRGIAAHLVPPMSGQGKTAEQAQQDTRLCYVRVGRVVLIAFVVILIGKLWGINFRNLTEAGLGAQIAANSIGFLMILVLGYMAWEFTNLVINRKLAREMQALGIEEDGEGGEGGGAGLTRMATILPILRATLQVSIIIFTILLALSQLGVNITPLLAGAGVLGLAVGFGAQTLVKDIVSGVFFLLDDAFRAGEFIDIGGTNGTVEKISLRSLQLRAVTGPIHVVPYGSISQLTNMSRDWVIMKLKFTIPFDTDLEKVRKLFKKIGQQMMEVPELAEKFLAPFKGQGAADVTDVGIVVRGKFTTRPGDQWVIRKEVYNRVQKAFEENGIEFARKEVRIMMPDSANHADLSEDQKLAIATAASEAAENPPEAKK